jgi:hypothetical protein
MLIPFSCNVRCEDTGLTFPDFDATICAEIAGVTDGREVIDVTQVWITDEDGRRVDLAASNSPLARSVAWIVCDAAERSEKVLLTLRDEAWVRRQERAA